MGSKETYEFISKQKRLLRPMNLLNNSPGKGFDIYKKRDLKLVF